MAQEHAKQLSQSQLMIWIPFCQFPLPRLKAEEGG
jgi:hypothetical protein